MEVKFNGGHYAEVAPAAAHPPEQIGVFAQAGREEASLGCHHINQTQIITGQAVFAGEPPDAPAQRKSCHPGA